MSKLNEVRIIGVGKALPGPPRTNEETLDHCNIIDKDDPLAREKALRWVKEKVGIDTRHTCREFPIVSTFAPRKGECNSDLGALAITEALKVAEMDKDDLDLIIVATCTPDYPIPSTASIVQEKLGIAEIAVIDIRSACCGSMQAMITAIQYAKTGYYKNIAVVGAEVGSVFGNLDKDSEGYSRQDFVNALMIGDGAGAVIFRSFKDGEDPFGIEILHYGMNAIGLGEEPGMYLPLGGSMLPATHERLTQGLQYFKHDFRKVLEHGPVLYVRAMNDALAGAGLSIGDIDLFVPHQANARIAAGAAKFQVPPERIFQNFQKVGNTANASLMLCMDDIATQGIVPDGGIILLAAAESTKWLYASMVLRWQNIKNKDARALAKRKRDPLWKRAFWTVGWFLLSAGVQFNKSTVTAMGFASAATLVSVLAFNRYYKPAFSFS